MSNGIAVNVDIAYPQEWKDADWEDAQRGDAEQRPESVVPGYLVVEDQSVGHDEGEPKVEGKPVLLTLCWNIDPEDLDEMEVSEVVTQIWMTRSQAKKLATALGKAAKTPMPESAKGQT